MSGSFAFPHHRPNVDRVMNGGGASITSSPFTFLSTITHNASTE